MSSTKEEHKGDRERSPKKRRKHEDSDQSETDYSSSSSSSPSSSSEKHKKHKKKRDKKEKKDREKKKKEKKEKKKHNKKHKDKKVVVVDKPISEDDYFLKSVEFRTWLKREKGLFLTELKSDSSRSYFKKFVSKWNEGKLTENYYTGTGLMSHFELESRSSYQWKLKRDKSEFEIGTMIDEIERDTNTSDKSSGFRQPKKVEGDKKKLSSSSEFNNTPNTTRLSNAPFDEEMDEEDRFRYEKALQRKKDHDFKKTKETILEELVPKETGREAVIEKRKQQREWNRKGDSPETREDLGDDSSSFQRALAREKEMKAKKEQERQQKLEEYKKKEEEKMAPLRALAAKFQQQNK